MEARGTLDHGDIYCCLHTPCPHAAPSAAGAGQTSSSPHSHSVPGAPGPESPRRWVCAPSHTLFGSSPSIQGRSRVLSSGEDT